MQKRIEMGVIIRTTPLHTLVVKLVDEDHLRVITCFSEEDMSDSEMADFIKGGSLSQDEPGNDEPWPQRDVLAKLAEAAEILMTQYNHDGHGHEEIITCIARAKSILSASSKDGSPDVSV